MSNRPLASLSLDLDNKWSYLKTHGNPHWRELPTYFDQVTPRFLSLVETLDLKMTVFTVGQDAARPENREALQSIVEAGHEIGNHSFHHEPWLHLYEDDQLRAEFDSAEEAILEATGVQPIGFRGPGYSCSDAVIRELTERNYHYDASPLPTFIGPLARLYYFFTAKLNQEQKQQRKRLFGRVRDGFASLRPRWLKDQQGQGGLVQIPVTTCPLVRTPIHFSYLLYLSSFSPLAARTYFRMALTAMRATRLAPSLLLHPLDFLGKDDDSDLGFFPAMNIEASRKMELVAWSLDEMKRHFTIVPMCEHAEQVASKLGKKLPVNQNGHETSEGEEATAPGHSALTPGSSTEGRGEERDSEARA